MEPLAALGIASNVIQIVEFGARLLSRGQEIYESAEGRTDEHAELDSAANTLADLYNDLKGIQVSGSKRLTQADESLLKLKLQSEVAIKQLCEALEEARLKGEHGKWRSIFEALKTIQSEKRIAKLAAKLESIRKQIDTALLIVLAQRMNTLDHHSSIYDQKAGLHPQDARSIARAQRKATLLDAVYVNKWQASESHDVEAFSEQLNQFTTVDLKVRFCDSLLARLYFPHMPDRHESISCAHAETFQWLLNQPSHDPGPHANTFKDWIRRSDDRIYWITGKPGSGKSTLMKFLYHHAQLDEGLEQWTRPVNLTKAGFYFWNSGSTIQMSQLGMLQTLLSTCIRGRNDLILSVFKDRWEQYVAFGGGQYPLSWPELRRAFGQVISDQTRKFFFLIDGLDEFDGEPKDLIELLLEFAQPNVKLCVASRPWLPFEDAFKSRPSLLLEQLTRQDITRYVASSFGRNEHYNRLEDEDASAAKVLIEEVVKKASGVFLWVRLVVGSLLQGLSNADRMSDLQARLTALPSDLEALFNKLLGNLESHYFEQACESFRLLHAYRQNYPKECAFDGTPTLLAMFYADDPDTQSCIDAPWESFSDEKACSKAEHMRRRLIARCKGLVEVSTKTGAGLYDSKVTYLHRTARDYIESDRYWKVVMQTTDYDSFNPEKRWASAHLWVYKMHPYFMLERRLVARMQCIKSALRLQSRTGKVQKTYLDEVLHMRLQDDGLFECNPSRLELSMELLHSAPGLMDYLTVLFEITEHGERRAVIEKYWEVYRKYDRSYRDSYNKSNRISPPRKSKMSQEQISKVLQVMASIRQSWKPRLHRNSRPVMPEYE